MASDNEGRTDAVSSEAWKAELKTLLELSDDWLKKADSFEVTRGDSEVEGAYYDCAYALRKRIGAWHEYLWSVDSSDHDGDWVCANILGTVR